MKLVSSTGVLQTASIAGDHNQILPWRHWHWDCNWNWDWSWNRNLAKSGCSQSRVSSSEQVHSPSTDLRTRPCFAHPRVGLPPTGPCFSSKRAVIEKWGCGWPIGPPPCGQEILCFQHCHTAVVGVRTQFLLTRWDALPSRSREPPLETWPAG